MATPRLGGLALLLCAARAASGAAYYALDATFSLPFPAGVQRVTALAPGSSGALFALQRAVEVPFLCHFAPAAEPGSAAGAWRGACDEGANNVTMDSPHGSASTADGAADAGLLVTDIAGGTVKLFSQAGALLGTGGTQGKPGTGVNPIQFSAPADIAVTNSGLVVVSDGDGGAANRVVALRSKDALNSVAWVVGHEGAGAGEFSSPHSVAYDSASDVLFVADRGNSRVVLLAPSNGSTVATWAATDCFPGGVPWGLRVDVAQRRLVVADGAHAALMVFDLGAASPGAAPACSLVANISVPTQLCGVPHELAIMPGSLDVFVACVGSTVAPVAGPTSVLRFVSQPALAERRRLRG
jgi:DNA-binding beta-propeller fold protein YncE